MQGLALADLQVLAEPLGEGVKEAQGVGVRERVPVVLRVPEVEGLGEVLAVAQPLADGLGEGVAVAHWESVGEGVGEAQGVGDKDTLAEGVMLMQVVAVPLTPWLPLSVEVALPDIEPDTLTLVDTLRVLDTLLVREDV